MSELDHRPGKRAQTRSRLAEISFALFEQHGYDAVSMEQIAREAGVVRATLYNHFPVKEAVLACRLHELLAQHLQLFMQAAPPSATLMARLESLLASSAQWWEAHRQYAAPYVRYRFQKFEGASVDSSSDMVEAYASLIAAARKSGELRTDDTPQQLANYLHFLYLCALTTWLGNPDTALTDELSRVLKFFIRGAADR